MKKPNDQYVLLAPQKNHLYRRQNTIKHLENSKTVSESSSMKLTDFLPKRNTFLRRNVAKAEIKLVVRMISHNHSFKCINKLDKFNSNIYPDSTVAKLFQVTCSRTKSKGILQFLVKEGLLRIVANMKEKYFSLIIDETTEGKTCDNFFRMVQSKNGTGDVICTLMLSALNEYEIPLKNFIGFTTDNASTSVGEKNGAVTLLKQKLPHLLHIGCVCHSINLMDRSSLDCIPDEVEQLLRKIFKYFKSSKRQGDFREQQNIFDVPEHKILRLSDTRWLSFV